MMSSPVLTSAPGIRLRLSLPCTLEKVRPVARAVLDFLAEAELSDTELRACELALVEACNNAVLYATAEGRAEPIEVEAACDASKIELQVNDHTGGFELPENFELPEVGSECGRGLFIIHSLMDRVRYINAFPKNSLIMEKHRATPDPTIDRTAPDRVEQFTRKLAENEQIINEMAEELSSCYESLSAIFRCGAELGKTNNLEKFSHSLCEDLLHITDADWFVLRIALENETRLMVFTASDTRLELAPLSLEPGDRFSSVERAASATREDVWFDAENPLAAEDPLSVLGVDSLGLVHPCFFAETLIGTLAVGKNTQGKPLTASQANVVHTFADFLAIQIVNARLREEHVGNRLISHELQIAKNIQRALLPKTLPELSGFGLAGYCESARQVGGDFYDVLPVTEHSFLLIIADVMGKGIPAAMFAAILRSLVRAAPELITQPDALLGRVNRLLFDELSNVEMFITAQLVYVDLERREIVAASAGHCPLLLISDKESQVRAISPDGLPLGILPDTVFLPEKTQLEPGSRMLAYTDGLTDAQSASGDFFGQARLLNWFAENAKRPLSATQLKESLAVALRRFQGHTAVYDDQTFLILAEEPPIQG